MKKNQFVYVRRELIPPKATDAAGAEPKFVEFQESFNINKVIRSVVLEDGRRLILLDDMSERYQSVPVLGKNGKIASYKREKDTFQSEIYLDAFDSERFIKFLAIEE